MSYLDKIPGLLPHATPESIEILRVNVPPELRALRNWVAADRSPKTRADGTVKSSKAPINPRSGGSAKTDDATTWGTFDEAVGHALINEKCFGVGVNLLGTEFLGLDLDRVIDPNTGTLLDSARVLIESLPKTYTEVSPSGRGLRLFYCGSKPPQLTKSAWKKLFGPDADLEVYDRAKARYLTVTGRTWTDAPLPIATVDHEALAPLVAFVEEHAPTKKASCAKSAKAETTAAKPARAPSPRDLVRARWGLLEARILDPDCGYEGWLRVGVALKCVGAEGLNLWDDWSKSSRDYDPQEIAQKWPGLNGSSIGSLFGMFDDARSSWRSEFEAAQGAAIHEDSDFEADEQGLVPLGERDKDSGRLVLSARRTLPTARAFVREFGTANGVRTLHSYATQLWRWQDNRYVLWPDEAAASLVLPWLHKALTYQKERNGGIYLAAFQANPATVKAAIDTLHNHVHISADTPIPVWLDGRAEPVPTELVPCKNGTLHVPTRRLLPPDPHLFNTNAVDFDYQPDAPAPQRWLQFLTDLFGDEEEAVQLLQEWFGYCLVADTSQQKILLLVGPRRSGKGTIGRVIQQLVGVANVTSPTVSGLSGSFGLQPLIGKSLATISDARFVGPNVHVVVERLLTISGEDAVTIDRKHITSVTHRLPTRFMVLTNELPTMRDASTALAGRFLTLQLQKSFFGKEDRGLSDKLIEELPGILLWALDGWDRLHQRGHFHLPASSRELNESIEDLGSPVNAFVRERCESGAGLRVDQDVLYTAYRAWCGTQGHEHVPAKPQFARDFTQGEAWHRARSLLRRHAALAGARSMTSGPITVGHCRAHAPHCRATVGHECRVALRRTYPGSSDLERLQGRDCRALSGSSELTRTRPPTTSLCCVHHDVHEVRWADAVPTVATVPDSSRRPESPLHARARVPQAPRRVAARSRSLTFQFLVGGPIS